MTNAEDRYYVLGNQIKLLKEYNAGSANAFAQYQRDLESKPAELEQAQADLETASDDDKADITRRIKVLEEQVKALNLVQENNIDLSNRYDVTRLVSLLETERYKTMEQQLVIIQQLEDTITDQMIAQGMIPAGRRFVLERDLGPMDQSISPPQQTTQPTGSALSQ
jgi:hypothetical protein